MLAEPGQLSRLGAVTPHTARELTAVAACDPGVGWKVIVTDERGRAIAVTRVRRARARSPGVGGQRSGLRAPGEQGPGLVAQVTLTVPACMVRHGVGQPAVSVAEAGSLAQSLGSPVSALGKILAAALAGAAQATASADAEAAEAGPGGCAHRKASPAYRPPPRLREFVAARDQTCRFGPCRQPACRADQDHTIPYDQGGLTCDCNLGGACRTHHKVKQRPGWQLIQPEPGAFVWVTPAGRAYAVTPDAYSA
jgi:hypothetical protein